MDITEHRNIVRKSTFMAENYNILFWEQTDSGETRINLSVSFVWPEFFHLSAYVVYWILILSIAGSCFGLRWFTPACEVPLCGHATLASAAVLFDSIGKV